MSLFFIKHRNFIPMVGVQHIQVGSLKALKIAYTRDNIPRGMKFSWDLIFRGILIDPRKLNRVKTNSRLKNKSAKIVTRSKVWNPNCAKICSSENYKKNQHVRNYTCAKISCHKVVILLPKTLWKAVQNLLSNTARVSRL